MQFSTRASASPGVSAKQTTWSLNQDQAPFLLIQCVAKYVQRVRQVVNGHLLGGALVDLECVMFVVTLSTPFIAILYFASLPYFCQKPSMLLSPNPIAPLLLLSIGEAYEDAMLFPVRGEGSGGVGKPERSSTLLLGILGVIIAGVGIGTSCLGLAFPSPLIA